MLRILPPTTDPRATRLLVARGLRAGADGLVAATLTAYLAGFAWARVAELELLRSGSMAGRQPAWLPGGDLAVVIRLRKADYGR